MSLKNSGSPSYALPCQDETAPASSSLALSDLQRENTELKQHLAVLKHSQNEHLQHLIRARAQQNLLARLAAQCYASANPVIEAAQLICHAACNLYALARVSLWRLEGSTLHCTWCFSASHNDAIERPAFNLAQYPHYWAELEAGQPIDASLTEQDPRLSELRDGLIAEGIGARLDVGLKAGGQLIGLLSIEHCGGVRHWQTDELSFANELANLYGQILAHHWHQKISRRASLFQQAIEQSANGVLLLNPQGRISYVNPSFTQISQFSANELCGKPLTELTALEDIAKLLFDEQGPLQQNGHWQGEFRCRRKNLEPYWGRLRLSRVLDDQGRLSHYIGVFEDITESFLNQQRLERLAYTDALTGLSTRSHFIEQLDQHFAQQSSQSTALLLLDIDNFKRINDSLGHATGDKLLQAVALRLRNSLGEPHLLARLAGNEFAVLLRNLDAALPKQRAYHLLNTLEKPLFVDNQLINLQCSAGLALTPEHGRSPIPLIKNAGLALHKAKANGKGHLQVFDDALIAEASDRLFLESNLRHALRDEQLQLYYQPQLCLKTGKLLGLEALLRWQHPERGMIRPDQFIQIAEDTGLIVPIGLWVARQACRTGKRLSAQGFADIRLAINLSPRQFGDPDLVESLARVIREEGFDPHQLEVELTESLLLDANAATFKQLQELKALGLKLAMDDFGTGYSSLSYLKKFPIDIIKIDRSFVRDIPHNGDDMQITAALVAMAHSLRLKVVAEGIETTEQLSFLRTQHCDIGQGYLFDQPLPEQELISRLRQYQRGSKT